MESLREPNNVVPFWGWIHWWAGWAGPCSPVTLNQNEPSLAFGIVSFNSEPLRVDRRILCGCGRSG
jgi:hypothetical protein